MTDSWQRCPDCQDMLKKYGIEATKVCDKCTHLFTYDIRCACEDDV